jgi:CTP synthase (UTP-ammonia lyase)
MKEVEADHTGTMSPKEHGECFVLNGNSLHSIQNTHIANIPIDGGESDLDLGNYERYITLRYRVPSGCRLTLPARYLGLNLTVEVSSFL